MAKEQKGDDPPEIDDVDMEIFNEVWDRVGKKGTDQQAESEQETA
jgi:hypothetical protein